VSYTNSERSSRGISRLSVASDLTSIARRHSQDMAAHHGIYHDSNLPNEVRGWRALGENVGRGGSASQVHHAFMGSSTHRTHILSTTYNQLGIGAVWGNDGYLYVTEVFARRGTVRVTHAIVHRATRHVRAVRHRARAAAPKPKPIVFAVPDRAVGMLLELIALDTPDTVQTGIAIRRPSS